MYVEYLLSNLFPRTINIKKIVFFKEQLNIHMFIITYVIIISKYSNMARNIYSSLLYTLVLN